jgi:hypothetical protein
MTEREVMSAVARLAGQCTIVLVAHLASRVRNCALLYELVGGTVLAADSYASSWDARNACSSPLADGTLRGVPAGTESFPYATWATRSLRGSP